MDPPAVDRPLIELCICQILTETVPCKPGGSKVQSLAEECLCAFAGEFSFSTNTSVTTSSISKIFLCELKTTHSMNQKFHVILAKTCFKHTDEKLFWINKSDSITVIIIKSITMQQTILEVSKL